MDGLGLRSARPANVEIRVDDDDLTFRSPQLRFSVREDVSPYSRVGRLLEASVSSSLGGGMSVYDSNADGFLSLDPSSGVLRTEARLDHERRPDIILNVRLDNNGEESYCQVRSTEDTSLSVLTSIVGHCKCTYTYIPTAANSSSVL